jgi:hypothetical protein
MVVFNGLHILGVLEILDQFSLYLFNNLFFIFELLLEVFLFAIILILIFSQLIYLHPCLEDQILEVVLSVF